MFTNIFLYLCSKGMSSLFGLNFMLSDVHPVMFIHVSLRVKKYFSLCMGENSLLLMIHNILYLYL